MDQEKTTFTRPFGTYAYRRMPFDLCNAPSTFQRCMLAIFHDMIEESVEVFMDDFSVFGNSFDNCLNNLDRMLQRCKDANLSLTGKILLEKDTPFEFDDECHNAFKLLKEKLTCAPVIMSPNWNLPFELMCYASDFTVGAVLEFDIEIKDKKGTENVAADYLSRFKNDETSDDSEVDDNFPGETFMKISTKEEPWFVDFANYLALKNCNPDLIAAGEKRIFQLHEVDELRHQAYENSRLHKARTKVWHDRKLKMRKEFKNGNKVLLFHSKYKFKQPKPISRWPRPYVVKHQYPSGYVELYGKDGKTFIVNGHRLKLYHEEECYNDQREAVTPFFPKE
ncbi:reverse transcriptase domain-containing protein [Tanacetum coccineum]